jgi:glutamate racemase
LDFHPRGKREEDEVIIKTKYDNEILKKDHLRIIVTDSGLGGLSVQALLDRELRKLRIDTSFEIIFYNSLASHDYGYNSMASYDEKVRVFDIALSGMIKLNPDIILIACNTLSVLYKDTQISKSINIPVLGIVDSGVDLILEEINRDEEYSIILFGTETTIASKKHSVGLLAQGINETKITAQACKDLESEIQIDPESDNVRKLVEKYVSEASKSIINNNERVLAVLCCTHYGYSKDIFQEVLSSKFGKKVSVLNPNEKMAKVVVNGFYSKGNSFSKISNQVLSKVDINESEMEKLSDLLLKDSPSVSKALINHIIDQSLFII